MVHDPIRVFDLEKDLATDKELQRVRKAANREPAPILFDPDEFKGRSDELVFDKCRLSEDELRKYAKIATEIRQKLKSKAEALRQRGAGDKSQDQEKPLPE